MESHKEEEDEETREREEQLGFSFGFMAKINLVLWSSIVEHKCIAFFKVRLKNFEQKLEGY